MAATILFYNNGATTLAAPVGSTDTTATLATGTGSLFSPGPTGGQYFCMTFSDAATGLLNEIVHVTSITGDVITIVRAQEGTAAQNWSVGDNARNFITAAPLESFQVVAEAAEADKWTTARNLIIGGDANGTFASVDGTADVNATLTLGTVNANVGSFGSAGTVGAFTVNAKGLITAASNVSITPAAISAVPTNRTISTTSPITGGGDLSANRTIAWDFTAAAPFTGNITVPTQSTSDSDTSAASTAFVHNVVNATPTPKLASGTFPSWTTAQVLTFSLGSLTPQFIIAQAICTTAQYGYNIGDTITVAGPTDNAGGVTCGWNGTTGWATVASAGVDIIRQDTGATAFLTPADWTLKVIAYGA